MIFAMRSAACCGVGIRINPCCTFRFSVLFQWFLQSSNDAPSIMSSDPLMTPLAGAARLQHSAPFRSLLLSGLLRLHAVAQPNAGSARQHSGDFVTNRYRRS